MQTFAVGDRNEYGCYFFNEELIIEVILAAATGPIIVVAYMLAQVEDTFGIRPAIVSVLVTAYFTTGTSFAPN